MGRKRFEPFASRVSFLQVDFKQPRWTEQIVRPQAAIVSVQAVHELRHKKYAPDFYRECLKVLRDGGRILICDRLPKDDSEQDSALFMTTEEQVAALREAGFAKSVVRLQTAQRVACRAPQRLIFNERVETFREAGVSRFGCLGWPPDPGVSFVSNGQTA